jgi:hypothetical protein
MFSQKQTIGSREGVDKLEIGNFKLKSLNLLLFFMQNLVFK